MRCVLCMSSSAVAYRWPAAEGLKAGLQGRKSLVALFQSSF
jgi:hypothetical protein